MLFKIPIRHLKMVYLTDRQHWHMQIISLPPFCFAQGRKQNKGSIFMFLDFQICFQCSFRVDQVVEGMWLLVFKRQKTLLSDNWLFLFLNFEAAKGNLIWIFRNKRRWEVKKNYSPISLFIFWLRRCRHH